MKKLAFLLALFAFPLYSQGYFQGESGFRWDRINNSYQLFGAPGTIGLGTSASEFYKNLWSYQIGLRAFSNAPFEGWILKGAAHYGWLFDGDFNVDFVTEGEVHGHTTDVLVGTGYSFSFCKCVDVTPTVGFSYDVMQVRVDHSESIVPGIALDYDDQRFRSSWYGPWVGLDIYFTTPCTPFISSINFDAGYEFHYGWSHLRLVTPSLDFTQKTHLDDMMGNVFHLEAHYALSERRYFGLRLQYGVWTNGHRVTGKEAYTPVSPLLEQVSTDLTWHSFSVTASYGVPF